MNRKMKLYVFKAIMLSTFLTLSGCGDDGTDADPAVTDDLQDQIDALTDVTRDIGPESCVVCHGDGGSIALSGAEHQAEYDKYVDSTLTLTIDSVVSTALGTTPETYDSTVTFTVKKNGAPYNDDGLSELNQKRFAASLYNTATEQFEDQYYYGSISASNGSGQYTATVAGEAFGPDLTDAQVYGYIASGVLETEGMTLYDDVANAGVAFGATSTYASTAKVSACEGCHGSPYMKHGYRAARVPGLQDFGGCKSCHVDTTDGTHPDWQLLKDNPALYADYDAAAKVCRAEPRDRTCDSIREQMSLLEYNPAEDTGQYFYKRNLMNDVHMSHNMEFPYPQSMKNCATCHEGNLGGILDDANYQAETCISCHAPAGLAAKMTTSRAGNPITIHDCRLPRSTA